MLPIDGFQLGKYAVMDTMDQQRKKLLEEYKRQRALWGNGPFKFDTRPLSLNTDAMKLPEFAEFERINNRKFYTTEKEYRDAAALWKEDSGLPIPTIYDDNTEKRFVNQFNQKRSPLVVDKDAAAKEKADAERSLPTRVFNEIAGDVTSALGKTAGTVEGILANLAKASKYIPNSQVGNILPDTGTIDEIHQANQRDIQEKVVGAGERLADKGLKGTGGANFLSAIEPMIKSVTKPTIETLLDLKLMPMLKAGKMTLPAFGMAKDLGTDNPTLGSQWKAAKEGLEFQLLLGIPKFLPAKIGKAVLGKVTNTIMKKGTAAALFAGSEDIKDAIGGDFSKLGDIERIEGRFPQAILGWALENSKHPSQTLKGLKDNVQKKVNNVIWRTKHQSASEFQREAARIVAEGKINLFENKKYKDYLIARKTIGAIDGAMKSLDAHLSEQRIAALKDGTFRSSNVEERDPYKIKNQPKTKIDFEEGFDIVPGGRGIQIGEPYTREGVVIGKPYEKGEVVSEPSRPSTGKDKALSLEELDRSYEARTDKNGNPLEMASPEGERGIAAVNYSKGELAFIFDPLTKKWYDKTTGSRTEVTDQEQINKLNASKPGRGYVEQPPVEISKNSMPTAEERAALGIKDIPSATGKMKNRPRSEPTEEVTQPTVEVEKAVEAIENSSPTAKEVIAKLKQLGVMPYRVGVKKDAWARNASADPALGDAAMKRLEELKASRAKVEEPAPTPEVPVEKPATVTPEAKPEVPEYIPKETPEPAKDVSEFKFNLETSLSKDPKAIEKPNMMDKRAEAEAELKALKLNTRGDENTYYKEEIKKLREMSDEEVANYTPQSYASQLASPIKTIKEITNNMRAAAEDMKPSDPARKRLNNAMIEAVNLKTDKERNAFIEKYKEQIQNPEQAKEFGREGAVKEESVDHSVKAKIREFESDTIHEFLKKNNIDVEAMGIKKDKQLFDAEDFEYIARKTGKDVDTVEAEWTKHKRRAIEFDYMDAFDAYVSEKELDAKGITNPKAAYDFLVKNGTFQDFRNYKAHRLHQIPEELRPPSALKKDLFKTDKLKDKRIDLHKTDPVADAKDTTPPDGLREMFAGPGISKEMVLEYRRVKGKIGDYMKPTSGGQAVAEVTSAFGSGKNTEDGGVAARELIRHWGEIGNLNHSMANRLQNVWNVFDKLGPEYISRTREAFERGQVQDPNDVAIFAREVEAGIKKGKDRKILGVKAPKEIPTTAKDINEFFAIANRAFNDLHKQMKDLHIDVNYWENYWPHLFKKPELVKGFAQRNLKGSQSMLKHRKYGSVAEAVREMAAKGIKLELRFENPVDEFVYQVKNMQKLIGGKQVINKLRSGANPIVVHVGNGKQVPEGYEILAGEFGKIKHYKKSAGGPVELGHWAATPGAAKVINNAFSQGLAHHAWYTFLRKPANFMNNIQLNASFFHLGNTAIDVVSSKIGLGLMQLPIKGFRMEGAKNLVKGGLFPWAIAENLYRGWGNRKIIEKGDYESPEGKKLHEDFSQGGQRFGMDREWTNGAVKTFNSALSKAKREFSTLKDDGKYGTILKDTAGLGVKSIFALVEKVASPVMEVVVPLQKYGVYSDMVQFINKRADKEGWSMEKRIAEKQKASISVDNRMGQVCYDNLFWNRTLKEAMFLTVRSVGWNAGTISEVGGGFKNWFTTIGKRDKLGNREPFEIDFKMAYTAGLLISQSIMGATYQYLSCGKPPEDAMDLIFPRTGNKLPDGNWERVSMPTYVKDLWSVQNDLLGTISNKVNPLLSTLISMVENRDYWGYVISDKDDNKDGPVIKWLLDEAIFAAKQLEPFSLSSYRKQKARGDSTAESLRSFIGIVPAPKSGTNTGIENDIESAYNDTFGVRTKPHAQRAADDIKKKFRVAMQNGKKEEAKQLIARMRSEKLLTSQQIKNLIKGWDTPNTIRMFSQLPVRTKLKIYNDMTPEERRKYKWRPSGEELDVYGDGDAY